MKGVNKVILVGTLGNDPESKAMPNGKAVTNWSMATSESWKDGKGEKQERTEWHRCVAFDKLAEIVIKYAKKGSKIYCEGKLQTRSWDQDGIKRYATEIIVNEVQLLDSKPSDTAKSHGTTTGKQYKDAREGKPVDNFDDDIPF